MEDGQKVAESAEKIINDVKDLATEVSKTVKVFIKDRIYYIRVGRF